MSETVQQRSEERNMAKKMGGVNADPLVPARTREDWEAQGWQLQSTELTVAPRLEATLSIRFDPESALLLRKAARLKGMTKSEFVRQATLQQARKTIDETPLPASMWVSGDQSNLAETRSQSATERTLPASTTTQAATTTRSVRKRIVR
jgi:hypothetical protein